MCEGGGPIEDRFGGRVLIVIPALNEAASVGSVVTEVRSVLPACDVLVVDDGSVDGTSMVAKAAGARVATLPFNVGVGGAMRLGFRYALSHSYDAVVQIDADGQHRARDVGALLKLLVSHDVVVGARFHPGSQFAVPLHRRMVMRFLAWLCSRATDTRMADVTSGFRAHGRRAIAVYAQHYPLEYLGDTVESLIIAKRCGLGIGETTVEMRPRQSGPASQSAASASRYVLRTIAAVAIGMTRDWTVKGEVLS